VRQAARAACRFTTPLASAGGALAGGSHRLWSTVAGALAARDQFETRSARRIRFSFFREVCYYRTRLPSGKMGFAGRLRLIPLRDSFANCAIVRGGGHHRPSEGLRALLEKALGCPLYYGRHRQVSVQVGPWQADVDEGIAPLIRELRRAGVETLKSCQQNKRGRVWLCFPAACEAERFLNLVARFVDGYDQLYWRMKADSQNVGPLPDWEYAVNIEDRALLEEVANDSVYYSYDPPPAFVFSVSVRFPPQDLPTVLRRLREHNALAAGRNGQPAGRNGQAGGEASGPAEEVPSVSAAAGGSGMGPKQDAIEGGVAG
jgi:hypothetical protein